MYLHWPTAVIPTTSLVLSFSLSFAFPCGDVKDVEGWIMKIEFDEWTCRRKYVCVGVHKFTKSEDDEVEPVDVDD